MDQSEASLPGPSTSQPRSDAAASSSQWSRVRTAINSSATLRANTQQDREMRKRNRRELQRHALASGDDDAAGLSTGRVDDEGMGDEALLGAAKRKTSGPRPAPKTRGRPLSGVERWEPLAHLLEGEQQRRSRSSSRRQQQQQQQRDGGDTIAPSQSGLSEQSVRRGGMVPDASASSIQIVDEPQSTLDDSLDNIPYGQDPLEYADDKHLLDSDSDTDSDDDEAEAQGEGEAGEGKPTRQSKDSKSLFSSLSWPHLSPLSKGVSKCVAAYFLASLFTYSSTLSNFLAHLLPNHDPSSLVPFSNLHMIATVAVYFHPARSFGSMIEADIFAAFALSYSLLLSLSSMIVAEWLHDAGHSSLSNVISVVFFVGGGMAMVGWAKVKVGKPTFNTACSLIYVSTFTVVVKEGSTHLGRFETDKVWQVALVVLTGTLLSNLVCFLLWPRSATTSLLSDTSLTLDAYATLLKVLTRTFLLDDVADVSQVGSTRLNAAIHAHHTAFTSLQKNLSEAKYEAGFDARIRGRTEVLEEVVGCLQRLGQHLGGLRSSCGLQHEIIARRRRARSAEGREAQSEAAPDDGEEPGGSFTRFLDAIGPHMRSLVFSCARSLHVLETSVQAASGKAGTMSSSSSSALFDDLEQDLNTALRRFQHEQTIATKRVDTIEPQEGSSSAAGDEVAQNSATATQDEAVLVVFFFLFSLEELTQELLALVRAMRRFKQDDEEGQTSSWWGRRRRRHHRPRTLQQRILSLFSLQTPTSNSFPVHTRHMEDTAQTPLASTRSQRFSRSLWHIGQVLRQRDVKYAIKAGAGAALLACPAFIHSTRPTFKEYQGQWALVSFMVVISPTVGQSNQMSLHRLVGTVFGALVAVSIYALFRDDRLILPLLGALFSIPCFRYIVGQPHLASSGRFVLLTFNLTCLYAFNLRKTDVEAEHIGFQRTVAVAVGVVWATLLNHVLWPNEARRELTVGLSDLLFKMAWMYQYIVTSISEGPTPAPPPAAREHGGSGQDVLEAQPLIASTAPQDPLQQMDLFLRFRLLTLESLLAQTRHEPRLNGPFPVQTYKEILTCCTKILDKLHAMRCVTRRSEWATSVARDWIEPVNPLRREMAGNVLLFFFLLGSSLDLKTPLPPYLPPAERCRAELLSAVRSLPVVQRRAVRGSVEFLLFYSYCLAMRDVIKQLEELGRLEQKTFGVVGGSRERFERPFAVRGSDGRGDGTA